MERKEFLKKSLALAGIFTMFSQCKKEDEVTPGTVTDSTDTTTCTVTDNETEGPFPTKSPSSYVRKDITDGKTGLPLTVNIYIKNVNNNCAELENAIVDIWHCDTAGNYSEYGGTSMQSTNYTSVHFLRGRQTTDANGLAAFTSIYPGWYSGRAPHIHVHIYNSSGTSLLVTQIAFPEDISSAVYKTTYYTAHGQADTSNASDNIFSDSLDNELATLSGDTTNGYTLTHTIYVKS
ncbi:intradiol ring-cleavage dioxygenase [Xanthocytophaga agilis]|uniref:Intradiol ring-cleavage dioxygenase n=1 Tax=Xanthocytophaga agilis TaxID=3048010 RepID=A0AAE3R606_9BACT|nr:intradiol ring-cleavage dioxygenase [Xanthocytophaga agilis]MDJ1501443.1 intradiol ring-cleavage dioxygenase [Xanthocytophaga agilis]